MTIFSKNTSIAIFLILFFSTISFTNHAINNAQGENNTLKGPEIKIFRTVQNCKKFDNIKISPNRYILTSNRGKEGHFPLVYDIKTKKMRKFLPLNQLPGLPVPPVINAKTSAERRYKKNELIIAGKFWKWYGLPKILHYNSDSGKAGIFLNSYKTVKHIQGTPACSRCKGPTELVTRYNLYLCRKCRKYVNEKEYTKTVYTQFYGEIDLNSGRMEQITPLERKWTNPDEINGVSYIGVDPKGEYLYYSNYTYFSSIEKNKKTTGHILINRFNIDDKEVDKKYDIKIPVRHLDNLNSMYSLSAFTSADFSKIVFIEYDEGSHKKPSVGFLKNPTTQAYVVDTDSSESFTISIPVTAYGKLIDRENRYLLLGSNQTGNIHRYDLKTQKEDKKVRAARGTFKLLLSESSKYLYAFTKSAVIVYSYPNLKQIKSIPISKLFPGVRSFMVSEPMLATDDGRYAIIGVIKKKAGLTAGASSFEEGFHILMLGD